MWLDNKTVHNWAFDVETVDRVNVEKTAAAAYSTPPASRQH